MDILTMRRGQDLHFVHLVLSRLLLTHFCRQIDPRRSRASGDRPGPDKFMVDLTCRPAIGQATLQRT
jgi:hypothetical protein